MSTTKKTFAEEIHEAIVPITSPKGGQDFIFLREDERLIVVKTEKILNDQFNIMGKGRVIALACQMLLNRIEQNDAKSEIL